MKYLSGLLCFFLSFVLLSQTATTYPRTVNTSADLANIPIPAAQPAVRMSVVLLGTASVGDGNSGTFYWDYSKTNAADGFNYISSSNTAYASYGRWVRFIVSDSSIAQVATNIAQLVSTAAFTNLQSVEVLGYYNPGDGGQGTVNWVSGSTASTNLGTSFAVPYGATAGRFLRPTNEFCKVEWFGAIPNDGVDDYRAMTNCIEWARRLPVQLGRGRFDLSDSLVFLPNLSAGYGIPGRVFRGIGFDGTAVTNSALSSEHTTLIAHHRNPIIKYAGAGGWVSDLQLMYDYFPTTAETNAAAFRITGADTYLTRIQRIRVINCYDAFHVETGTYFFSSQVEDLNIVGYQNDALRLNGGGTQGLWNNIYITCNETGVYRVGYTETVTGGNLVLTSGTNLTFTVSSDLAASFYPGMLANITASDTSAVNGLHTVVNKTATSVSVDYPATISPAPTTATIGRNGGMYTPQGMAVRSQEYREDLFNNLNIEWTRFNGRAGALGDKTVINGLHLEGVALVSGGGYFLLSGATVINGWTLFNSFCYSNQVAHLVTPYGTNVTATINAGRVRDQYYNSGSSMAICYYSTGIANDFAYYDGVVTNNTARFNRTGYLNGANYAVKPIGRNAANLAQWGAASDGTVLSLMGGAAGARLLTLERSGVGKVGIGASAGTINFANETDVIGIGQWTGNSTQNIIRLGFSYTTTSPDSYLLGAISTGSNVAPGNLSLQPPSGTGNATSGGGINFYTPDAGASGTTSQTQTLKAFLSKIGNLTIVTPGRGIAIASGANAKIQTAVLVAGTVTVTNTSWGGGTLVNIGYVIPGGTPGAVYQSAGTGTIRTFTSTSGTDTSTIGLFAIDPYP